MRIYHRFPEALNEIKRDCCEMGIRVHPATWQDQNVANDPDFDTLELQNYSYTILLPLEEDLKPTQPWADAEWAERALGIEGTPVNPGEAWKLREGVWKQFIDHRGEFGYSYSDRFAVYDQVRAVIGRLRVDPDSRQCYVSVWNPSDVEKLGGVSRVPCTLGYQFQIREGMLNMHYIQRSADLITHFENDLFMAHRLHKYVADRVGWPLGRYTHTIFSLHLFRKDGVGVF